MKRITTLIAATAALAAGPALAATSFDTNDDGTVDAKEFLEGDVAAATFDRFDDDNNGVVTPEELGLDGPTFRFMLADVNNDGALSESELGSTTFVYYDKNNDAKLSENEMETFRAEARKEQGPFEKDIPRGMDGISQ